MTQDAIQKCIEMIDSVSNQCAFSSYACAGDPTRQNELKMCAVWAGTLNQAIQLLREHQSKQPEGAAWQDISTAPRDGTSVLLLTSDGVCEAWFKKGEWEEHHEYGPQYDGAEWVCLDDKFTLEVEETPDGYRDHGVTHWKPLDLPEAQGDGR